MNLVVNNEIMSTLIMVVLILISTLIIYKMYKLISKKSSILNKIEYKFINNVLSACIIVIGTICAIYQIPGMDTIATTLLASSGIIAAALSLVAQEQFGNIVSGVILSASKPFDIGDRLIIKSDYGDIIGFVENITLRHTVIRTFKNTEFIITNSQLDTMIIENTTRNSNNLGIVEPVDVVISYESDIDKALEIIEDIILKHELFYDSRTDKEKQQGIKAVNIRVRELNARGIELRAMPRTKVIGDSFVLCSDIRREIIKEFKNQGIEIPYTKIMIKE